MEYKIDKNIPIPEKYKTDFKSIAAQLEVGDSVEFDTFSKASSFQTTLRRLGKVTTQRKLENSYRVWRTQ